MGGKGSGGWSKGKHIWKDKSHPRGMLGKKHSKETKKKMSLKRRKYNHPNWKGGNFINCLFCGKKIWRIPSHFKRSKKHFCSYKCADEWKSKNPESSIKNLPKDLKGEKHPNWQGGLSFEPYSPEFNEQLKEQIRKRDNYRCQECFRHQSELFIKTRNGIIRPCSLAIHHIDFDKTNNNPNNLISLCKGCHGQTQFGRKHWIKYFQKNMEMGRKVM